MTTLSIPELASATRVGSGANRLGEQTYNVGLTYDELDELIRLIDDDSVDEELLTGVRRKLVHKKKVIRQRFRKAQEK